MCWTEEREKPELLAESPERRKRIAKDSGKTEQQVLAHSDLKLSFRFQTNKDSILIFVGVVQVSNLVAQIFQMRVKMKNLMGVMEGGSIPALSGLEDALKEQQKVSSSSSIKSLHSSFNM